MAFIRIFYYIMMAVAPVSWRTNSDYEAPCSYVRLDNARSITRIQVLIHKHIRLRRLGGSDILAGKRRSAVRRVDAVTCVVLLVIRNNVRRRSLLFL